MARGKKFASIDTYFTLDPYIQRLNPNDRWVYFILLCNPDISMIGVYEISLATLVLYTGMEAIPLQETLSKFATDQKIHYVDNWVIIKNYLKNNPIPPKSASLVKGAYDRLELIPWSLRERLEDPRDRLYIPYFDKNSTLCIPPPDGTHTPRAHALAHSHALTLPLSPEPSSQKAEGEGGENKTFAQGREILE